MRARFSEGWHDAMPVLLRGGDVIKVQAKRLCLADRATYRADYQRFMRTGKRGVIPREPGEESLSEEDVYRNRLLSSAEFRARERAQGVELTKDQAAFLEETCRLFVRVVDGELVDDAGAPVVAGADLWAVIQDDEEAITQLTLCVLLSNELAPDTKKKLPSLPDLMRGSPAPGAADPNPNGSEPAPIAEPVNG